MADEPQMILGIPIIESDDLEPNTIRVLSGPIYSLEPDGSSRLIPASVGKITNIGKSDDRPTD